MSDPSGYTSLQLVRMRLAKLNANGSPMTGQNNGLCTDAIIDLTPKVQVTTGADLEQKNGSGSLCATFKDCDTIKRLNVDLTLCVLDPLIIGFLTAAPIFWSSGNPVGWQYPSTSAACPNGVSLEVWTRAWDNSQQATPPNMSNNVAFWHFVFPLTKFTLGDVKLDNSILTVPVTGTSEENDGLTANGPFNDWPNYIAGPGGITHVGGVFLDTFLPAVSATAINVPFTGS